MRQKIIVVIALLTFTLAAGEVMARVINGPWRPRNIYGYTFDSHTGVWLKPGPRIVRDKELGHDSWYINTFGMQDDERSLKVRPGTRRIAIFGDSFVEGQAVKREERFSNVLEKLLGPDYEALNFGISSLGTVHETEVYKFKAKPFSPDIVILTFYQNDVCNNSRTLEDACGYEFLKECPYYTIEDGSNFVFHPAKPRYSASLKERAFSFLKRFYLFRAYSYIKERLRSARFAGRRDKNKNQYASIWPARYIEYGVYSKPRDAVWEEAWAITEHAILNFKTEAEKDGAVFILLLLASDVQLVPDPAQYAKGLSGVQPPQGFDPAYPNTRLMKFAEKTRIQCIDMLPILSGYRKERNLSSPYLWFKDNLHYNAVAHELVAEAIKDFVIKSMQGC